MLRVFSGKCKETVNAQKFLKEPDFGVLNRKCIHPFPIVGDIRVGWPTFLRESFLESKGYSVAKQYRCDAILDLRRFQALECKSSHKKSR